VEAKAKIISSEFQSGVSPEDASAGLSTSSIRTDFERLLEFAEIRQQSYEEMSSASSKLSFIRMICAMFYLLEFAVGFVVMFFELFNQLKHPSLPLISKTYIICLVSFILALILGIITSLYYKYLHNRQRHIKRLMTADERDLSEIIELLREIEPVYAKEEKISALERVQIRIRLSRFGIGSSSRSEVGNVTKDFMGELQIRKSRVDQELFKPS